MADTLKQLLQNQASILQELQTLREEQATGLKRNSETLKIVNEISQSLDTLQESVFTLDSRVRITQQKQTRLVSPYSDVENANPSDSNNFASRRDIRGHERKKKLRGQNGGYAGGQHPSHVPFSGHLQTEDSDQSEESNFLSKQTNRKPALQSKLSPSISQPGAKLSKKEGAIVSPVSLFSDPPPNTARPLPRTVSGVPTRQNPQLQLLSHIKKAPPSGQSLIKPTTQEADLIQVMKKYGLAETNETVTAVSSAMQRSNIPTMRAVGLHTVFVLDTSASMAQYTQELRTFVNKTIDYIDNSAVDLGLEEHIAIVTCGGQTGIGQHFTNDYLQIRNGLDHLTWQGRTPMLTALILALFYLELQGESIQIHDQVVAPRIVLVSDFNVTSDTNFPGRDEESSRAHIETQGKLYTMCDTLKSRGYMVTCVPVAVTSNQQLCNDIAEATGGDVVTSDKAHLVGNFYKYQLVSAVVMERYYKGLDEGEEPDIDLLVEETLPLANLPPENTDAVRHVIEKDLLAVGPGSDIDNDSMEKDADTTAAAAAEPHSALGRPQQSLLPQQQPHKDQQQQQQQHLNPTQQTQAHQQMHSTHRQQQTQVNQHQQQPVHSQQQTQANQQMHSTLPQQQTQVNQPQQSVHPQQQTQAKQDQVNHLRPSSQIVGHASQPQPPQLQRKSAAGLEMNPPLAQQLKPQNKRTSASSHKSYQNANLRPGQQQPPPQQQQPQKTNQPLTNSAIRAQASPQTSHVGHELPPWGHSASGMDDISLEERGLLPCIGTRVKKVRSGVEDGAGLGTVVGHKDKNLVFVLWDTNHLGTYKYDRDMTSDIVVTPDQPRQVPPMEIDVGCWVVRGEDWDRGDEDGGQGTVGVVIRKLPNRYVMVRWPSRVVETYRFGADNKWELEVTLADNQSVAEGASEGTAEGVSAGATFSAPTQPTPNAEEGERPQVPGEEGTMMVWQWQDFSSQWRLFNYAALTKLESSYNMDPSKPVMVHRKNQSVTVNFTTQKCQMDGNEFPIRRLEVTLHYKEEMKMLEEFMMD